MPARAEQMPARSFTSGAPRPTVAGDEATEANELEDDRCSRSCQLTVRIRWWSSSEAPEPTTAPDEALVRVEAFSINRGETFLLERPRHDWRPGRDISGRVIRAAADGSGPAPGARVVGHPQQGGWAQLAGVPSTALAVLPDVIDVAQAAALPLAGLTALRLLRASGAVAGLRVLLTGASGGVGHYVTELASAAGASVTAVSASPSAPSACSRWARRTWCSVSTTPAARTTSRSSRSAVGRCRRR